LYVKQLFTAALEALPVFESLAVITTISLIVIFALLVNMERKARAQEEAEGTAETTPRQAPQRDASAPLRP
jgi:hypothetical protein